jgi:hypothetical protein
MYLFKLNQLSEPLMIENSKKVKLSLYRPGQVLGVPGG